MKKTFGKGKAALLILLVAGSVAAILHNRQPRYITNQGKAFGTFYNIKYSFPDNLQKEIDKRLAQVDNSLSPFNKRSVITAVNDNRDIKPDTMFRHVFSLSQKVSRETRGAFDITVAPLVNAWGFGFEKGDSVTPAAIRSLLKNVGYTKVSLSDNGRVIKQSPDIKLDCSAIAKGYGCDAVASLLDSMGIKNYLVEIGGEIVAKGENPEGEAWRIGINRPDADSVANASPQIAATLQLTDCAMATSGNYRRYYYKNGKRYAHTIDPRTGHPVQHTLLSATVVAPDCATADAYATAFMVLGTDSAKKILRHHPELKAYFISSDHKGGYATWTSPGLSAQPGATNATRP